MCKNEAVPSLFQRGRTASFFVYFSGTPGCHAEVRLERPVKIGEVLKPAPGSDGQNRLIRGLQRFGGGVEPVLVQKGHKALPGHLPEPPHEVAGTEGADPGGIGDPEFLGIMGREPLQERFQPLGVGCLGGKPLPALCKEQGKKPQQCPLTCSS